NVPGIEIPVYLHVVNSVGDLRIGCRGRKRNRKDRVGLGGSRNDNLTRNIRQEVPVEMVDGGVFVSRGRRLGLVPVRYILVRSRNFREDEVVKPFVKLVSTRAIASEVKERRLNQRERVVHFRAIP